MHFSDSPVLWIRLDPEITLLRSTNIEQPDYQWQYQLRHERDVIAQIEAIASLERYPTPATRLALTDTIENEGTYYKVNIDPPPEFRIFFCPVLIVCFSVKVRCKAAHCLTKVANAMIANWAGPPAMLTIFRKLFGSFSCPHIMKQNNFQNFQHYYLQKVIPPSFFYDFDTKNFSIHDENYIFQTIPIAMAGIRNVHGICPPDVIRFLLDLFKYNDNSKNLFSDNYYRASLIEALAASVTPVISVVQQG